MIGDPLEEGAAFAPRVANLLTEVNTRQPANFTTQPGPTARLQYNIVLYFNPAQSVTANTLCREPDMLETTDAADAWIELQMAFCNGVVAVSSLEGSVSAGDDEGRFRSFLGLMLAELLPRETPRRSR